ncbi:hypothetical protein Tco_1524547 [Tanacetum coccineum]
MKNINEDHFCSDGCTGSGEARVQQRKRRIQRRVQQKQKDQEDEVFGRILSAKKMKTVEGLKTAGYKVTTAGSRLLLLVKKLMLCTDSGEAGVQQRQKIMMKGRGFPEQKVNYKFRGGLLGIKLSALSTAKSKTVEGLKTAGYKVTTAGSRLLLLVKKLMLPNKLDLSYSGLEEFQQPEFEVYGLRANKSVCENSSNETKKNSDAPLIEELF